MAKRTETVAERVGRGVTLNQCDGCRRNIPLRGRVHVSPSSPWDAMHCTADRYERRESYVVTYAHGTAREYFDSLTEALAAVREVFPGAWHDPDHELDLACGMRMLVWRDEASSQNDDGLRAVASISRAESAE